MLQGDKSYKQKTNMEGQQELWEKKICELINFH